MTSRQALQALRSRRTRRFDLTDRAASTWARIDLPLVAIFLASAAFGLYYSLKVSEWSVMTDELLYVKLGLSVGDDLSPIPAVHGEYFAVFNQLYPLLTAPIFQLFDMPSAFRIVHGLNAVLMASAAVPTYLLARELAADRAAAWLAAALSVFMPWMTMSTMILTEPLAYPMFVWAVLAMHRAIAEPSPRRDLVALAAIALAFLARTQFIVLAPILAVSILAHEVAFRARRGETSVGQATRDGIGQSLREHRLLARAGLAALVLLGIAAVLGSPTALLGNYDAAVEREILPAGIAESLLVHLDFVVVAIGIAPFVLALAWVVSALVHPADKSRHAYAVLVIVSTLTLVYQVSSFDLNFPGGDIRDRYLFYVVPLIAVGSVIGLRSRDVSWKAVLAAGIAFAAVAGVADYVPKEGPYFDSPATAFHTVLDGRAWEIGDRLGIRDLSPAAALVAASILIAAGLAAAFRYAPRQVTFWVVGVAVLAFCLVETRYVFGRMVLGSGGGRSISGSSLEGRDWIDRALPGHPSVALVPVPITLLSGKAATPRADFLPGFERTWWYAEAWNKSVDRAFSFEGSPTYTPFPRSELRVDVESGRLITSEPIPYVVMAPSDPRFRPIGRVVAADVIELLRLDSPHRVNWVTRGIRHDGWTLGDRPAFVRVYGEDERAVGRRVQVTLSSTTDLEGRRRYSIVSPGTNLTSALRPGETRTESLLLCVPRARYADLRIEVPQASRLRDGRLVGLRVVQVRTDAVTERCSRRS